MTRPTTQGPKVWKIYLAGHYARHEEMRAYRDILQGLGHTVTSRWIDQHGGQVTEALGEDKLNDNPSLGTEYAIADIADIAEADMVINFTGNGRGGRHVEFGLAYAMGKKMVLVGKREHVFHTLPAILWYPDWEALLFAWVRDIDWFRR